MTYVFSRYVSNCPVTEARAHHHVNDDTSLSHLTLTSSSRQPRSLSKPEPMPSGSAHRRPYVHDVAEEGVLSARPTAKSQHFIRSAPLEDRTCIFRTSFLFQPLHLSRTRLGNRFREEHQQNRSSSG